jgi:hypothetical protein
MFLMRNVAGQFVYFSLYSTTDFKNKEGQLSNIQIDMSKDGGAQTGPGGDVTELGNGQYCVELTAEDTDCETLGLWVSFADQSGAIEFFPLNFSIHTMTSPDTGVVLAADQPNYAPALAGDEMAVTAGALGDIAQAVLTIADGIVPGINLRAAMRVALAALAGKCFKSGGTIRFRNPADTKNVITATVDGAGNRLLVTLDVS